MCIRLHVAMNVLEFLSFFCRNNKIKKAEIKKAEVRVVCRLELSAVRNEICEPSSNEITGMSSSLPYFICTKAGMAWRRQMSAVCSIKYNLFHSSVSKIGLCIV